MGAGRSNLAIHRTSTNRKSFFRRRSTLRKTKKIQMSSEEKDTLLGVQDTQPVWTGEVDTQHVIDSHSRATVVHTEKDSNSNREAIEDPKITTNMKETIEKENETISSEKTIEVCPPHNAEHRQVLSQVQTVEDHVDPRDEEGDCDVSVNIETMDEKSRTSSWVTVSEITDDGMLFTNTDNALFTDTKGEQSNHEDTTNNNMLFTVADKNALFTNTEYEQRDHNDTGDVDQDTTLSETVTVVAIKSDCVYPRKTLDVQSEKNDNDVFMEIKDTGYRYRSSSMDPWVSSTPLRWGGDNNSRTSSSSSANSQDMTRSDRTSGHFIPTRDVVVKCSGSIAINPSYVSLEDFFTDPFHSQEGAFPPTSGTSPSQDDVNPTEIGTFPPPNGTYVVNERIISREKGSNSPETQSLPRSFSFSSTSDDNTVDGHEYEDPDSNSTEDSYHRTLFRLQRNPAYEPLEKMEKVFTNKPLTQSLHREMFPEIFIPLRRYSSTGNFPWMPPPLPVRAYKAKTGKTRLKHVTCQQSTTNNTQQISSITATLSLPNKQLQRRKQLHSIRGTTCTVPSTWRESGGTLPTLPSLVLQERNCSDPDMRFELDPLDTAALHRREPVEYSRPISTFPETGFQTTNLELDCDTQYGNTHKHKAEYMSIDEALDVITS